MLALLLSVPTFLFASCPVSRWTFGVMLYLHAIFVLGYGWRCSGRAAVLYLIQDSWLLWLLWPDYYTWRGDCALGPPSNQLWGLANIYQFSQILTHLQNLLYQNQPCFTCGKMFLYFFILFLRFSLKKFSFVLCIINNDSLFCIQII